MDGVDVALLETDGETIHRRGPGATFPYDRDLRRSIAAAIADARQLRTRADRPGCLDHVENELTVRHADALAAFMAENGTPKADIDIVGFHGQTVLHRPEDRLTVQLGDGQRLAELTGLRVAWDMRADDVAAGGQGAPLAPIYHRALVSGRRDQTIAVLNIGGVANVTCICRNAPAGVPELLAFDTGPGNALIDDWIAKTTGAARDEDGRAALSGQVHDGPVQFFLSHAFFSEKPPKSLDRNAFFWDLVEGLSVEDGAATLVAMTAGAVAAAVAHLPRVPDLWIVCGGGRHNRAILNSLRERLSGSVLTAEEAGFDGDTVESEAWAFLAVRCLLGKPLTFPGTTGAPSPMPGGRIATP